MSTATDNPVKTAADLTPAGDEDAPGECCVDEPPPAPSSTAHPSSSPSLEIDLTNESTNDLPFADWLTDRFSAAAEAAGVVAGRVTLAVVNDPQMAELHEQYQGVSGTTDVLTFDLTDPSEFPDAAACGLAQVEGESPESADGETQLTVDGDLVLCIDEATRQAESRGHEVRKELLLYAVHGLLHLLGFDDATEADAQRMHDREDELLTRIGVGPVYRRADETPADPIGPTD